MSEGKRASVRPRAQVVFRRIRSHPMADLEPSASMMIDLSFNTWSILHTVLHVFLYHDIPDGISTLCCCPVCSCAACSGIDPGWLYFSSLFFIWNNQDIHADSQDISFSFSEEDGIVRTRAHDLKFQPCKVSPPAMQGDCLPALMGHMIGSL